MVHELFIWCIWSYKEGSGIGLTCLVEKFPISCLANDILKSMCKYVFGRGPGLVSLQIM